jgi:formylglycine-generating enzyme required for sulfatase activity
MLWKPAWRKTHKTFNITIVIAGGGGKVTAIPNTFPAMKSPKLLTLAASVVLITSASATVTIDWVTVGHAGNAADTADGDAFTTGVQRYGAVGYTYQIGKYEVTNAQYTAFLNAADPSGANANGVYNSNMGSNARGGITYTAGAASGAKYTIRTSMGDKPVNYVSWYDAARFANWLHNGQGSGSTETGAYTLSLNTGIITKNGEANVWLPSEDEWYKAAYYDPTPGAGGGDNYWRHATQSNTAPTIASANSTGDISNPGANVANYASGADWGGTPVQNGNVTTVGSAAANNYFGTADQGGNLHEWNDAVIDGSSRGLRGASWFGNATTMSASARRDNAPTNEGDAAGFRVASVPEPTSLLLSMFAGGMMLIRRKR